MIIFWKIQILSDAQWWFCRYNLLKQELANLTELHEREICNLKEELISTQESIDYTHEKKEFHVSASNHDMQS